jgi:hypothetical protein
MSDQLSQPGPALTDQPSVERRALPRGRTFWKGTILFPGGLRSIECTVRNFTPKGARLDCGAVVDIPDHFELKIPQRGETFACHVVWRRSPEIGVGFAAAEAPSEDALARKMKALEEQNHRLMRRIHDSESGQG